VESARGAVFKRDSYLAAQYRRLVKRRGDKKAIVAVVHSLLVMAYHVLRDGQSYRELGGDYFDHLNAQHLTRYHTQRLAALGYAVTLTKSAAWEGPQPPFTVGSSAYDLHVTGEPILIAAERAYVGTMAPYFGAAVVVIMLVLLASFRTWHAPPPERREQASSTPLLNTFPLHDDSRSPPHADDRDN
jgi:hypothetical protein